MTYQTFIYAANLLGYGALLAIAVGAILEARRR